MVRFVFEDSHSILHKLDLLHLADWGHFKSRRKICCSFCSSPNNFEVFHHYFIHPLIYMKCLASVTFWFSYNLLEYDYNIRISEFIHSFPNFLQRASLYMYVLTDHFHLKFTLHPQGQTFSQYFFVNLQGIWDQFWKIRGQTNTSFYNFVNNLNAKYLCKDIFAVSFFSSICILVQTFIRLHLNTFSSSWESQNIWDIFSTL